MNELKINTSGGHCQRFATSPVVPTRVISTDQWKCCETGSTVFRPCPRRLENLIICRCQIKGSTFFSVI